MECKTLYHWPTKDKQGNDGYVTACSLGCATLAAKAQGLHIAGDWTDYAKHPLDYCEGCENQ